MDAGEVVAVTAETVGAIDTAVREHDVIAALESRYAKVMQTGRRYITAPQVRNAAGFDATRTFDYVAIDTWTSGHLAVHIFEIKVARSDWLRELKQPQKTAEALRHADFFWIAATPDVVKLDELPDRWGLVVVRTDLEAAGMTDIPEGNDEEQAAAHAWAASLSENAAWKALLVLSLDLSHCGSDYGDWSHGTSIRAAIALGYEPSTIEQQLVGGES